MLHSPGDRLPVPARPAVARPPRRPAGAPPQQRPQVRLTKRGKRVVVTAVGSVVLTGLVMMADGLEGTDGPPQPTAASAALPGAGGAGGAQAAVAALPESQPLRIKIPKVSIDAPLMNVALDKQKTIETPPPQYKNLAAWYKGSVSPGADGTSVIVGHVDNASGPAVFYGLGALKKDARIEVARADGTTAIFTIYGIEVFSKKDFPAKRVYGDTARPELRVITCGGTYTKANGYSGNVVVFARMTGRK